jgi:hypothetical protein
MAALKKRAYDVSRLWITENFFPIRLETETILASRVSRHRTDFSLSGEAMFVVAHELIRGSRVENWKGINP